MQPVSGRNDETSKLTPRSKRGQDALTGPAAPRGGADQLMLTPELSGVEHKVLDMLLVLNSEGSVAKTMRTCLVQLLDLFKLYGLRYVPCENYLKKQCVHFQNLAYLCGPDPELNWVPVLKWKLVAFANAVRGIDAPPSPNKAGEWSEDPRIIVGGAPGRWLLSLFKKSSSPLASLESLAFTVKQAKMVMVRPSEAFVAADVVSSGLVLTTSPSFVESVDLLADSLASSNAWAYPSSLKDALESAGFPVVFTRDVFKSELKRTFEELFPIGTTYSDADRYRPVFPSTSAHYNYSRGKGGAVTGVRDLPVWGDGDYAAAVQSDIRSYLRLLKTYKGDDESLQKVFDVSRQTDLDDRLLRNRLVHPWVSVGDVGLDDESDARENVFPVVLTCDTSKLDRAYSELYKCCLELAAHEESVAKLVGLREALKARVISAQGAAMQFVLKPLQKWMHGVLRRHPTFTLLGEPVVNSELLRSVLGEKLGEHQFFRSGDWKNATNLLHRWPSEYLATLLDHNVGLSFEESLVLKKNLAYNWIEWKEEAWDKSHPDPSKWTSEEVQRREFQLNGQLMGSVTSFPFLCIINAAVCRFAVEFGEAVQAVRDANPGVNVYDSTEELKVPRSLKSLRRSLARTPLLINGDDNASRQTKFGSEVQNKLGAFVGLHVSVGKDYLSRDFVEINSVQFSYSPDTPVPFKAWRDGQEIVRYSPFNMVEFVRMGLLRGMKRSEVGVVGLSDVFTAAGSDNLGSRCTALIAGTPFELRELVMRMFIDSHREVLDRLRVPWFMPQWLGGVGLPCVFRYTSDLDREVVFGPTDIDLRLGHAIFHRMIATGQGPLVSAPPSTWRVHKYIQSIVKMKCVDRSSVDDDTISRSDRLYAALACEAFLVLPLHEMVDPNPTDPSIRTLRHNEKLWRVPKSLPGASYRLTLDFIQSSRSFVTLLVPASESRPSLQTLMECTLPPPPPAPPQVSPP
jgi:hypothetical protein